MTPLQRKGYFRRWAAACLVQGRSPDDEAMRRDVTLTVTGKASTSALNEDEITHLYRFLEWQADPDNLDKATEADPKLAAEANRRRQLTYVIEGLGFNDAYIARPAQAFCQEEEKATWRDLSSTSLEKLRSTLKTRARQRGADAGERDEFTPRALPYHKRPAVKKARAEKRAVQRELSYAPRKEVASAIDAGLFPF